MSLTSATVPWWYVAALAGAFTLLGALVSLAATWLIARRKNRLDDDRRFEADIIEAYVRLDELTDVLHNNAGGEKSEENKIYWETLNEVSRIDTRLELIAPRQIFTIVSAFRRVVWQMNPVIEDRGACGGPAEGMPELVEHLQELRKAIRRHLRVGAGSRSPLRFRMRAAMNAIRFRWDKRLGRL